MPTLSPTATPLKVAGWPFLVILVADVMSNIHLLTVNVMALVFTAMTMPLNTMFSCFLGLGCVVWLVAAGAFVTSARDNTGMATRAAANRLRTVILEMFFVIMVDGLFSDCSLQKTKQHKHRFQQIQRFSPRAFRQQFCDASRQILCQQRQRLAFRVRQIRAHVNQGVTFHVLVEQHLARDGFARGDVRDDANPVILRRRDVIVQIAQPFAVVVRNHAADDDVATAMRGEVVSAVGLEPFAQRLRHRVAEPRLQGLVVERQNFNRLFAGDSAIDRTEMITGATGGNAAAAPMIIIPGRRINQLAVDT